MQASAELRAKLEDMVDKEELMEYLAENDGSVQAAYLSGVDPGKLFERLPDQDCERLLV